MVGRPSHYIQIKVSRLEEELSKRKQNIIKVNIKNMAKPTYRLILKDSENRAVMIDVSLSSIGKGAGEKKLLKSYNAQLKKELAAEKAAKAKVAAAKKAR